MHLKDARRDTALSPKVYLFLQEMNIVTNSAAGNPCTWPSDQAHTAHSWVMNSNPNPLKNLWQQREASLQIQASVKSTALRVDGREELSTSIFSAFSLSTDFSSVEKVEREIQYNFGSIIRT